MCVEWQQEQGAEVRPPGKGRKAGGGTAVEGRAGPGRKSRWCQLWTSRSMRNASAV